jgi:membrane peptidoglycan carboxypeptidase
VASIAVLIMVAGGTLVGGTYVFAKVPAPEALPAGESTTIYYADGKTEMAKIALENRTIVSLDKIPKHLQHAVIATEDGSFYSNEGVDISGIVRAAWNNFTGGERQGASTITQQYARKIAELTENSYKRKAEEAAVAMKLADKYTKDQILYFYLNTVYFGRSAYGVEAAARAYFNLNSASELTVEQSIFLAGTIKNPDGGGGSSAFDPNVNPEQARIRFEINRNALVDLKPKLAKYGSDTYQVNKEMKLPEVPKFNRSNTKVLTQFGLDTPTGHVVHNVMDELMKLSKTDSGVQKFIKRPEDVKTAGLRIVTTIDQAAQGAAQTYADVTGDGSPLKGIPKTQTAALVAVEPYTGRVVAYYGGNKGSEVDFAGSWEDPVLGNGKRTDGGFHPPASSFKIYTLAAAMTQKVSVNSWWDGTPKDFPGRLKGSANAIKNANAEGDCAKKSCQLWQMTRDSLNVPFYALTLSLDNQAAAVLETARAAGVTMMRDVIPGKGNIHFLNERKTTELANTGKGNAGTVFDTEIGFGQYPITVIDHANGVASLAAGGQTAKAHFISEIYKDDKKIFTESKKLTAMPNFTPPMAADMAWTLEKVATTQNWNPQGRKVAAKTGTWENGRKEFKGDNAHSWTVGYAPANRAEGYNGVAVAVWVGNKGDELPIKTADGAKMQGATGAGKIFDKFIKKVSEKKPKAKFPEPKFVGDEEKGDGKSPTPSAENNQSQGPGQGNPGPGGNNPGPGGGNTTLPGQGNGGGNGGGRPGGRG